jgi:hypothetical protein
MKGHGFLSKREEKMAQLFEEKRKSPRIKVRVPMRYQIRGSCGFNNTVCDNMSHGGLGFTNNEFIAPRTPVMLEINLPSRVLRPIGKIAWSSPIPHSNRYQLGLEFLEINPEEKNCLCDFIDMQIGRL